MTSASTRAVAVLGSPIRHSLSPVLHGAAFAALGMDWVCLAFDVDEERAPDAFRGLAALGFAGASVTMPLKDVAHRAVDVLDPAAERLGAVNCVSVLDDGRLAGHNTDGAGFLDALPEPPAGRRAVVLGAGGAARAVIAALAEAHADIVVVNRTVAKGARAAALGGRLGTIEDVAGADLVVNATSIGMGGTGELPCDPALLHEGQVAIDLVYHPVETAWLVAAREQGATAVDGVGMLVHQAAHAFRHWTGTEPPVAAMEAAARAALR
jgi:shikimate dehydrogenase